MLTMGSTRVEHVNVYCYIEKVFEKKDCIVRDLYNMGMRGRLPLFIRFLESVEA